MGAVYAKLIANISTAPVSIWAVWREKLGARSAEYFKPLFILLLCLALYAGIGQNSFGFKAILILLYFALSVGLSVITVTDITTLFDNLKPAPQPPVFDK